jgi:23S rRNA (adenine2030-N6)-methyltransferase
VNYRHAFHAGNFADCVKHAVLVWLLQALRRKAAPIHVLDTHAGVGAYDLSGPDATRSREATNGIARLQDAPPEALRDYIDLVRAFRAERSGDMYPGSPSLIRMLLRPDDRLTCCELHPEDHAKLRRLFAADPRVGVHRRDAWEALGALLPPSPRRGLVLIDPPFEAVDEFERLARGLVWGHARFPNGVFAAWYPIKRMASVRAFRDRMGMSGVSDIVTAELMLREPLDPARLNGCGLMIINPPYGFETDLPPILFALRDRLAAGEAGSAAALIRLTDA